MEICHETNTFVDTSASCLMHLTEKRITAMKLIHWSVPAMVVVSLVAADQAQAVTITWTGGAGTNAWGTPANWNLNRVPGAGDDVVIPVMSPHVNVAYPSFAVATLNSLTS